MVMTQPIITIVPYLAVWPRTYAQIAGRLRDALGDGIVALHHIGSTAVPGLAAKDVIDIQVTVGDLNGVAAGSLADAGFVRGTPGNDHCPPGMTLSGDELAKQFYTFGEPRAHIHIRQVGRFNQRYPLLCRDYLRAHQGAADAYAQIKRRLAAHFPSDPGAYYDIKDPTFDLLMAGAEAWAARTGWAQPPGDGVK